MSNVSIYKPQAKELATNLAIKGMRPELMHQLASLFAQADDAKVGEEICRQFALSVFAAATKGLADSIIVSADYKGTLPKTLALVEQLATETNRLRSELGVEQQKVKDFLEKITPEKKQKKS